MLKRELSKCQDQVRGFLRCEKSMPLALPSPSALSSRPHSFISVESDPMDLESDPRPNSYISLESDTPDCPASEEEEEGELEEEDPSNRCQSSTASLPPFPPLEAGDPDLTPTREDGGGIDLQASSPPTINNAWDQQVEYTVLLIILALPFDTLIVVKV